MQQARGLVLYGIANWCWLAAPPVHPILPIRQGRRIHEWDGANETAPTQSGVRAQTGTD